MPKGRERTASQAIALGFKYENKTPYVWGGNSWAGIDCSHFVCKCFGMGYETTATMVSSSSALGSRDFTRYSISVGKKPGDIVVFNGHTGICAKKNGIVGVLQSYGGHGVGWISGNGGGGWTHIWRPKEGMGIYPIKWERDPKYKDK